jgi:tetratricopeptide (TPR) repeat protein
MKPLVIDEAVKLLRAWGGDQAHQSAAVERICGLVGGLPLAVRLAGRYLDQTGETAGEYLDWLETTPIQALARGEHREDSIAVLLKRSLEQVSDAAGQVLAVVGLLALAPFGREPVAAALELTVSRLRLPLGELVSYGLLLRDGDRYEVSHALIHTYASRRLAVEAEAAARLAAYYTELAQTESEKGLEGYHRLDAERAHLMRVLAGCVEREDWEAARSLVGAVGSHDGYLHIRCHWTERIIAIKTGVTAAQKLGERRVEGVFLDFLGTTYRDLGQVEQAIEYHQQALTINQEIGDQQTEGICLGNLGNAYRDLGQVEPAIEYHEQALTITREIGDRRHEGIWLGNLGTTYSAALGQAERAIEYYEQALAIAREIGDRRGEAFHCWNLGLLYEESDPVRAVELMSVRVAFEREIGHPDAEADAERVARIQAKIEGG